MRQGFGGLLWAWAGGVTAQAYIAGYLIEKSLSADNLFLFAAIFAALAIPARSQHRVLMLGIGAAFKKGEIKKTAFAAYIDQLRLSAGLKQIFGTQATILNGFLVLFPITDERHVDDRRKQYDLPPLADYLRGLEKLYRLPLIKSTGALTNSFSDNSQVLIARATDSRRARERGRAGSVRQVPAGQELMRSAGFPLLGQ